jgi:hypothetical protein
MASFAICPYCFESWSTSIAAFRCLGPADDPNCPRAVDEDQARLLGGEARLQKKVVTRSGRFGRPFRPRRGAVVCDCGARTTPVCPHCHSPLPHGYADGGDRMIGMIGTKASGKSHYIAVLMHELFQGVGRRFSAIVELLDDDTRTRYERDLVQRIYEDRLELPATDGAVVNDLVKRPLGVRITFGQGNGRSAAGTVNAVFFDTAGEDLGSARVLEREARYIGQCGALVLLVDPLQIPAVRELVGSKVHLPEQIVDPLGILTNVTELVRRERGIAAEKRLTQPLAVVFSKLDAIRGLFDEDSPVLREPSSGSQFDAVESRSIGGVLRAQLIEWLGPEFDAYVNANYEHANYFAVSALGSQPEGGRLTRDATPHRVADPLLWVLSEWGAIPAMER